MDIVNNCNISIISKQRKYNIITNLIKQFKIEKYTKISEKKMSHTQSDGVSNHEE